MDTKTLEQLTPKEAYHAGYQEGHSHGRSVSAAGLAFWALFCIFLGCGLAALMFALRGAS